MPQIANHLQSIDAKAASSGRTLAQHSKREKTLAESVDVQSAMRHCTIHVGTSASIAAPQICESFPSTRRSHRCCICSGIAIHSRGVCHLAHGVGYAQQLVHDPHRRRTSPRAIRALAVHRGRGLTQRDNCAQAALLAGGAEPLP